MRVEHSQHIIHIPHKLDFFVEDVHRQPWNGPASQSKRYRRPARDDTGSRRDSHQPTNHAIDRPNNTRLPIISVIAHGPAKHTHRRANVRIQHRHSGIHARRIRVPAIESIPADPQDSRADKHAEDVVGAVVFAVGIDAGAEPPGAYETGGAAGEVDDVAAGVVDDTEDGEEPAAPDGVGGDTVGEGQPERDVDHPREEIHAAEEGAGGDDEGNGCEDELEVDHRAHGEIRRDAGGGEQGLGHFVLHGQGWARDAGKGQHVFSEGDFVAPDYPAEEDHGEGVEAHEGAVDGPFRFDDAGVED